MAVVHRFLDAANHHDSDTLYATVHPEFESFQPLHPDRDFRGPGQLISNWKAIFEAEPGFRLTVLRASTTGNTVWVELHGAGDSAEAAGIFIVGVENGRIRWVRVYSDLVEAPLEEALPDTAGQPGEADDASSVPSFVYASDIIERPAVAVAPATVDQADDGDSVSASGGTLWLVEPPDEPEPETAGGSMLPSDPGLRLVDPRGSVAEAAGEGPDADADAGPVETLVGPSRTFPTPPPADETTPIGASLAGVWGDDAPGKDAPAPDQASGDLSGHAADEPGGDGAADGVADLATGGTTSDVTAGASFFAPEPAKVESSAKPDLDTPTGESPPADTATDSGTDGEAEPESASDTDSDGGSGAVTEEPSTPDEPDSPALPGYSYDTLPQEPRLSRWRKALRKD